MSYLDLPRLHFAGEFQSDPSTANNVLGQCCEPGSSTPASSCTHNNAVTIDGNPDLELWNKNGTHSFSLRNCTIRSVVDSTGKLISSAAADAMVGAAVESTNVPRFARLVDIDPQHQTSSQIWALSVRIKTSAGESVTGTMATATMRDLWMARAPGGFAAGFGGAYQSVLTNLIFNPASKDAAQSAFLKELIGLQRLSIKMVLYGYDATPGSSTFTVGKVVGAIGPAAEGEPTDFLPDRRLVHAGATGTFGVAPANAAPFNTAPFKVDTKRRVLVVDLGNALPESAPGTPRNVDPVEAQVVLAAPKKPATVGTITNTAARYLLTAGIHEIPLTADHATALAIRRLQIMAAGKLSLAERGSGIHVDVSETVVRLNPGETKDLEFRVTQFGRPMPSANVFVDATKVGPGAGRKVDALSIKHGSGFSSTLALGGVIKTAANGRVTIRLVAGDPKHPRAHVDGQVFFLGFFIHSATAANQRGQIVVRVFDKQTVPEKPVFANVRPFLLQYFRMYPSMRFINLSDETDVRKNKGKIATSLRLAETHPGHMPVTRDLSRDNKTMLLKYLDSLP